MIFIFIKTTLMLLLLCFQRFLQRFIDSASTEDENAGLDLNEPLYMQKLEEVKYPLVDCDRNLPAR